MMDTLRILLLEEGHERAVLAAAALGDNGYECDLVHIEHPDELAAALAQRRFYLIVADLVLASAANGAALDAVREGARTTPLIIVADPADEAAAIAMLSAGATDYVI